MNDYLEALENFKEENRDLGVTLYGLFYLDIIKRPLQALGIIKEKRVNVAQFIKWLKDEYNRGITYDLYLQDRYQEGWYLHLFDNEQSNYKLTEEEFDLLREVLL